MINTSVIPATASARLDWLIAQEGEDWVAKRLSRRGDALSMTDQLKNRYIRNDRALAKSGFFPCETLWLATESISTPSMNNYRDIRTRAYNKFIRAGGTREGFEAKILAEYEEAKQVFKHDPTLPDPWARFHAVQDERDWEHSLGRYKRKPYVRPDYIKMREKGRTKGKIPNKKYENWKQMQLDMRLEAWKSINK
jgi:hypothetical protein